MDPAKELVAIEKAIQLRIRSTPEVIRDMGRDQYKDMHARGYQTASRLPFHNDSCDIVGLCCLETARSGGLSAVGLAKLRTRCPISIPSTPGTTARDETSNSSASKLP